MQQTSTRITPAAALAELRAVIASRPQDLTIRDKTSLLALSFPELSRRASHAILPFDALDLDRWARSGAPGHGGLCAARFVLSVWDPGTKWNCGRFDIHEALGIWDDEHRKAFSTWAQNPWWP
jgi:hypothetical protein